MEKFTTHVGTALPLRRSNVDTDQIIPAVYLKRVTRTGFEDGLFGAWRNDPDFVLNQPQYAGVTVLVAGPDFGTGSSREHAVWALMDYGFKVCHLEPIRRHLPRQLRQGRAARRAGRPGRRGATLAARRSRPHNAGDRRPRGSGGPRRRRRRAVRHRRLHALASARGARRHRHHAVPRRRDLRRTRQNRPSWKPITLHS